MKDLQQAIEEMLDNYYIQKVGFIVADIEVSDSADFIKELTQLITSREQEIREEAVRGFVEFNKGRLRTQSFNIEQLKQLYFDDIETASEYLSQKPKDYKVAIDEKFNNPLEQLDNIIDETFKKENK